MIRTLGALFLALLCGAAQGQTTPPPPLKRCHPNNFLTPWGTGSDWYYTATDKASGRFVFCQQPDGGWNLITWQFRINGVQPPNSWNIDEAASRIKPVIQAATSGVPALAAAASAAIEAEFTAAGVPLSTPLQKYEFWRLKYKACREMLTAPFPVLPPGGMPAFPANWCDGWNPGPNPPTPVPQPGWDADGTTIFKYANGRLTSATTRKATKDAPCDGVTVVTAGIYIYQGLVGGPADEKTACSKVSP